MVIGRSALALAIGKILGLVPANAPQTIIRQAPKQNHRTAQQRNKVKARRKMAHESRRRNRAA